MEFFPVLIIGTGPAGATLALHLGKMGIKALFVSRHRGTANTPRAHIFNQRAMEVLRDAGLEERVAEVASSSYDMQHTSWSNTLSGEEYGRMWAWGNKPSELHRYAQASPCARSPVVESLGIPIIGKTINSAFNVHIEADLSKYMVNRPGSLNWVLNTEAPEWSAIGNFRMVRPWGKSSLLLSIAWSSLRV